MKNYRIEIKVVEENGQLKFCHQDKWRKAMKPKRFSFGCWQNHFKLKATPLIILPTRGFKGKQTGF